jgi:hypothetical protein
MLRLSFLTLLGLSGSLLHAEFVYQETTRITGGSFVELVNMAGPLAGHAREPDISTHMLKGDRMVTLDKDRATVIDLSKESITEIDFTKKTYSVAKFDEMKQALENAMPGMRSRQGDKSVETDFKVSAKATGRAKSIQNLEAKELLLTVSLEQTGQAPGRDLSMTTEMDNWMAPVPGYEEVRAFQLRMGEKMGYLFGAGMPLIGMMRPQIGKSLSEAAKEMAKLEGMPIQSVMKMTGTVNGSALRGRQPAAQGPVIEITTELTSFSPGPVDDSKFEVPTGFKQVESELTRQRAR